MNVIELNGLTYWIDKEIRQTQIAKKYQALHRILVQNMQANQQKAPFEEQKEDLLKALRKVPLDTLTTHQLDFIDRLGMREHLGREGADRVEDVLFRNALDLATAAERMDESVQALNNGLNKATQIQEGLKDLIPIKQPPSEKVLVRVGFYRDAEISDIVTLRKWSETWFDIGRGIALIHDLPPEEVRVVGAEEGSIVIDLMVVYKIAETLAVILLGALVVTERVQKVKIQAEQLTNLKLQNEKLARELKDQVAVEKKAGAEQIVGEVVALLEEKKKGKDKKKDIDGEQVNAVKKSVQDLLDFLDKGGEVDCVIPETEEPAEGEEASPQVAQIRELRESFTKIRQLEGSIKLIEAGTSDPQDSSDSDKG